jgi:hypothetical protein
MPSSTAQSGTAATQLRSQPLTQSIASKVCAPKDAPRPRLWVPDSGTYSPSSRPPPALASLRRRPHSAAPGLWSDTATDRARRASSTARVASWPGVSRPRQPEHRHGSQTAALRRMLENTRLFPGCSDTRARGGQREAAQARCPAPPRRAASRATSHDLGVRVRGRPVKGSTWAKDQATGFAVSHYVTSRRGRSESAL